MERPSNLHVRLNRFRWAGVSLEEGRDLAGWAQDALVEAETELAAIRDIVNTAVALDPEKPGHDVLIGQLYEDLVERVTAEAG